MLVNYRNYDEDYEDECSRKDLGNETIQAKFGASIVNCCEFDGYVDIGECGGTDRQVF